MQNPKQVLAKSVILDRISLDTPDCTDSSLKQHISNLRKKLREADGREYIEAVWGIGFKLSTNNAQLRTLRSQRLRLGAGRSGTEGHHCRHFPRSAHPSHRHLRLPGSPGAGTSGGTSNPVPGADPKPDRSTQSADGGAVPLLHSLLFPASRPCAPGSPGRIGGSPPVFLRRDGAAEHHS